MSTTLPMLLPSQATGSGENTALPVNTAVGESSQGFANLLSSHFQTEGMASETGFAPLLALEGSALMPLLSVSSVEGQNLPLDLSQAELPDGNGLPLSPELMWSGMLIVGDSNGAAPQLYQLSEDGQTLTPQMDPNMRTQLLRAMGGQPTTMLNGEMPTMLNLAGNSVMGQTATMGQTSANTVLPGQMPGHHEQSLFFTATGTSPTAETIANQKLSELLPAALMSNNRDAPLAAAGGDSGTQGMQVNSLALGLAGDADSGKLPDMAQLQMSGNPRHPAWSQGLGERVQWMVQQNIQGAEIRLNPPDLGKLEVKIQVNGDTTQVHFSSPNGAVREAIEHALPRLREMFADSGLSLGDVNVSHQSFAEQQQNGGEGGEGAGRGASGLSSGEIVVEEQETGRTRVTAEGLVDMYV